jgi:O-antigen/teichoic acid export membrane protein
MAQPDADIGAPQRQAITPHDVAKGTGTTLLARLGGVIEVVTQPLYVWLFGLAGYGLYAVLWAAINLIENVADLGMTSALQRTVPKAATMAEQVASLRAALLFGVTPCLAIATLASVFAPAAATLFNAADADAVFLVDAIRVFAWALPLWAFVEIATSALRAKRVFGAEIRLRLVWEQSIRAVLAVILYIAGFGLMAIFIAHLTSLAIVAGLSVRLLARQYDLSLLVAPAPSAIRADTFKAGLAALPANMTARLFGDGPPIILNAWIPGSGGAVAAGLYTIARKISSIVQLVRTAFAYVMAPLAAAASTGEAREVREIYGFATRLSVALVLPLAAVLSAAGALVLTLFGTSAAAAYPALVLLIVARAAEAITGAATPIQQVTRGYWEQQLGSLAGLVAATAITFATMPEGGVAAMGIAVTVGFLIASLVPITQLWRDGLHPFDPPFLHGFGIALGIAVAAALGTQAALTTPTLFAWPAMIAILLGSLWVSCRFALAEHDRAALGTAGQRLKLI